MLRAQGGAKICGVFRVKNQDFTPNYFFPILGGGEGAPWIHPWKQNAFKFKIAPQKQNSIVNSFWQEDGSLLANGILCLGTMINPPLHLSHWDNIKDTTNTDTSTLYFDLHLKIDSERRLRTRLYDIRDDFNFPIVNFPFMCSNIPASPAYGVYISQLTLYFTDCA